MERGEGDLELGVGNGRGAAAISSSFGKKSTMNGKEEEEEETEEAAAESVAPLSCPTHSRESTRRGRAIVVTPEKVEKFVRSLFR